MNRKGFAEGKIKYNERCDSESPFCMKAWMRDDQGYTSVRWKTDRDIEDTELSVPEQPA